ncbi:MAG TPA: 6-carboxytetrahydropterin synthase QueD [Deltaproteobacteria bacterium]|nr:MAG: 6-carboxytetrahydropterin synthase QueD [Deltaproteobacteria bacterium GWA2_43_19]OGQ11536.1 MAG: 6-carboxytetrahydropterin synthase QueD [Deltaproteobacteria bacterium RIFCSPHIGHO2_02_FULL_43_33]OGQ37404.1 MAG: 6-carboxytetrahydropterin synthase QueD [Deltaproteobacteria bacterium RIFCSPLOWO2_01_FULL_42_9]HBR16902.1 6-carboxytetrahydropterin synthase QueD [Deltaproteobacteria bacterium]
MYELTIISDFAAAHNLRGYEGECENLHGHNWKVEVTVANRGLNKIGLAVDFKVLKRILKDVLGNLDHKYLNEIPPFDKENPSSENLARYIFKQFKKAIKDKNIKVAKVKVWESDNAAATYYE